MKTVDTIRPTLALGLTLVLIAAPGCSDATAPERVVAPVSAEATWTPGNGSEPFKVYTQNVYLGGDTGPIFSVDFGDLPALIAATNTFWAQVRSSDVPGRAEAIVDQIERASPHVVALEEAFLFEEVAFTPAPVVTATVDVLGAIQDAIAARGLPYSMVSVQENTTLGFPPVTNPPGLPLSAASVLRFKDRIAVLRRDDVTVTSAASGSFEATYLVGPLLLKRGWIRVSTDVAGTPHHVVATHLEGQALAPIQAAQASELLNAVASGLPGVTMLVGDFNSDAANPGAPSWTPTYDALLGAGFTDAWLASGHPARDEGFTCCQDPDLRNAGSTLDERIDFVLLRDARANGGSSGSVLVEIVGDEQADRTEGTGLWPADHAGLVAGLRLARGIGLSGS